MPRVLVIDDDRAILALAKEAISPIADVVTESTAREGLEQLHRGDIDVVLLDIRLPDRNGLAVYCEIRELDRRIPVIFMTIEAASGTVIEAMQLGAFDYIAKPLSVEPLRNLVETAIKQRQISSVPVAISANEEDWGGSGERRNLDFRTRLSHQNLNLVRRPRQGHGERFMRKAVPNEEEALAGRNGRKELEVPFLKEDGVGSQVRLPDFKIFRPGGEGIPPRRSVHRGA